MSSKMEEDEAVQIIKFTADDTSDKTVAEIDHIVVKRVFEKCGDNPVCLICICGPSRMGKSFILCHMIRYLTSLENGDWDWMDESNKSKPLTGFRFENQVNPLTQGIWVWSHPFIIPSDEGNVAVLLVDTQGTYDEFTTTKDMNTIVGLSLLLSSMTIFNFFTNLKEDTLNAFDTYIQYGLLANEKNAADGNVKKKPFQKLTFLIRDWNIPGTYPYGKTGGRDFLNEKLRIKDGQPEEARRVRKSIKECFKKIECFLMPNIGSRALEQSFTGSVSELSPEFAKLLEQFITGYLDVDNLVRKEILGQQVTAAELETYLNSYVEIFNSEDIPTAGSVWDATFQATSGNLLNKATALFIKELEELINNNDFDGYLPEEEFQKCDKVATTKALTLFRNSKKFGTSEQCNDLEGQLIKKLLDETETRSRINAVKKKEHIQAAQTESTQAFLSKLSEKFPSGSSTSSKLSMEFFDVEDIKKFAQKTEEEILTAYKRKFSRESISNQAKLVQDLEAKLKETLSSFCVHNEAQRGKIMDHILALQKELHSEYSAEVCSFLKKHAFADIDALQDLHEILMNDKLDKFLSGLKNRRGPKRTMENCSHELENSLDEELHKQENLHKVFLNGEKEKTQAIIEHHCKNYTNDIQTWADRYTSLNELKDHHNGIISTILLDFSEKENPFPDTCQEHVLYSQVLDERLDNIFKTSYIKLEQQKRAMEDNYAAHIEDACIRYNQEMDKFLKTKRAVAPTKQQLDQEHHKLLEDGINALRKVTLPESFPRCCEIDLKQHEDEYIKLITISYKNYIGELDHMHTLAEQKTEDLIKQCVSEYKKVMNGKIRVAENQQQFFNFHNQAKQFSADLLREVSATANREGSVCESSEAALRKLELRTEEALKDLKATFELKLKASHAETRQIMQTARQHYNQEMRKEFDNYKFIRPDQLKAFHDAATTATLSRFGRNLSSDTTTFLRQDFEKMLGDFQKENAMNLSTKMVPAIGIDLGTTNCCVGVYHKNDVLIIPNVSQGNRTTTPSYVSFNDAGSKCVSYGNVAKEQAYENPENTIFDVKRIIGKPMSDKDLRRDMEFWPFSVTTGSRGQPMIKVGSSLHNPPGISALLLQRLRESVETHLMLSRSSIKKAVITVPAYFDNDQRQATIDAGEIAGFEKVEILTEPVAAAFAYKMYRINKAPKNVLIYDLGGGTFDVAIINVESGIDVLAIGGERHLGGEDFDRRVMEYCAQQFEIQHKVKVLEGKNNHSKQVQDDTRRRLRRLQEHCERAKKDLSTSTSTSVSVDAFYGSLDLKVQITRQIFDNLNDCDFRKTITVVENTLSSINMHKQRIDDIILIGGSTRIPRVRELLQQCFNGKALNHSINADEAVAYGAARQAAIINGDEGNIGTIRVQDVTPMPLGTEVVTEELSVIVPRNVRIPCQFTENYTTVDNNQTAIMFKIFQGDKKMAVDNVFLGKFTIHGIPPGPPGKEKVMCTMNINSMGILHVTAVCQGNSSVRAEVFIAEDSLRIRKCDILELRQKNEQMLL